MEKQFIRNLINKYMDTKTKLLKFIFKWSEDEFEDTKKVMKVACESESQLIKRAKWLLEWYKEDERFKKVEKDFNKINLEGDEYIIVDSMNQWLATETNESEAKKTFNMLVKLSKEDEGYEGFDELGCELRMYKGREIDYKNCY